MKSAFFCFLFLLLGLATGLMINTQVMGETLFPVQKQTIQQAPPSQEPEPPNHSRLVDLTVPAPPSPAGSLAKELDASNAILLLRAYQVLSALRAQDYGTLSSYIHPELGVTFTPYSTVDPSSDRMFKPLEISKLKSNNTVYIWGMWDGSGTPIQYTLQEYFSRFVYSDDFQEAAVLGINHLFSSGNSLENVAAAYPNAEFIEFYLPAVKPEYNGLDWRALKLVFERYQGDYMLVGIIHSEWTT